MLYIMRHGKTDWNAVHRLQGSEDIPLNEEGRQMARDARKSMGICDLISAIVLPYSVRRRLLKFSGRERHTDPDGRPSPRDGIWHV